MRWRAGLGLLRKLLNGWTFASCGIIMEVNGGTNRPLDRGVLRKLLQRTVIPLSEELESSMPLIIV